MTISFQKIESGKLYDLNHYYNNIIWNIISQKNRIEKFLQISGFHLFSFIFDIFSTSGTNIILPLMKHDPIHKTSLDSYLKTKARNHMKSSYS